MALKLLLTAVFLISFGGTFSEDEAIDVMCDSVDHSALLMEPSSKCVKILKDFSRHHSSFLDCVLTNARPTCMCERCWSHFYALERAYDRILNYDSVQEKNESNFKQAVSGHHCTSTLLYGDKLNLLSDSFKFASKMWRSAACIYCVDNCTRTNTCNGSVLVADARDFYSILRNLTKCMAEVKVISEEILPANASSGRAGLFDGPTNKTNVTSPNVCDHCHHQYESLIKGYRDMKDKAEKEGRTICADIKDHVNKTRLQWGTIYGCEKNNVNVGLVVGLGIAASCLPILFYVGAKVCGVYCERQEAKKASSQPAKSPFSPIRKTFPNYGSTSIQQRKKGRTATM